MAKNTQQTELSSLLNSNIPHHVAVIMDGNGRWAEHQQRPRVFGHRKGVDSVRKIVEAAGEIGIEVLTLYTFSTENWSRPKKEVDTLMSLLSSSLKSELKKLQENDIRLKAIGDLKQLPGSVRKELEEIIEKTAGNKRLILNLALSYGSRNEIVQAVAKIAQQAKEGIISPEDIDENVIQNALYTSSLPDVDFMIRTGGEKRISNFLLWQIAYAELYFTDILWPDFKKKDFYEAIADYQKRERRFGKTTKQIKSNQAL